MQIGKVPNHILDRIVLGKIRSRDSRVLSSSGIGEDCGVLDLGDNHCIVSSDPITGAAEDIGKIAVHVACNDIATCGVRPVALMSTVLLPPGASEAELEAVMDDIVGTADSIGVSVIGGHTEVTDAVSRIVVSLTSIGIARPGGYVTSKGARAGDTIVMTKQAGLEGTAILAAEGRGELEARFGAAFVEEAVRLKRELSVIAEGVLAGGLSAHAMHDVTEGGVYGAVWELAEASGKGARVHRDRIPVLGVTRDVCRHFGIDPYRLVSSGSMLIATDRPGEMIAALEASGVAAAAIADVLADPAERFVAPGAGGAGREALEPLEPPGPDELYRATRKLRGLD
ncbi:MAG: AIR synthase family protein [Clostridiales bacterium]|jgi:hydrogenase maturation factor|nr:AIR synthase family protein [Clostridiales bacterium]